MPFPNEHSCRLKPPGNFQPGSFRRSSRRSGGKRYDVIMGRLKGKPTMTEQTYRYPKSGWTAAEARRHCADHDGSFEAAKTTQSTRTWKPKFSICADCDENR